LRERSEDVPELARHFLRKAEGQGLAAKRLEPGALELLKRHRWPGNVRELENIIRRLAALHAGTTVSAGAVAAELDDPQAQAGSPDSPQSLETLMEAHLRELFRQFGDNLPPAGLHGRVLREVERPLLSFCLAATRGNQIRAASLLGLNRNTLRKKMRELNLGAGRGQRSG
jgi:two-component system nitrogen regulation response regulator GlnG